MRPDCFLRLRMVRHHVSDGGAGYGLCLGQNPETGSNTVYKVGGEVSAPLAIHSVEPEYTEAARNAKILGSSREPYC